MAKKPQTEEKAKGLLKNVGNYKGKTLNLSKKQLGASGRAAAGDRKIAISRTYYDAKTKKVIGPMGKPITGRVDLGGGNIAVYKNGVRVRAQAPSSKPKDSGDGAPTRKPKPTISMRSAERLRRGRNVERGVAPTKLPGGNAGMIPRPKGLVGAGRMSGSQAGLIDRRIGQAERVPTSDREAGGRGSREPIMFANGTASVFDKNLRRRVTVGPKDPRHPKYKG